MDDHEPEQVVVDRVYAFLASVNRYLGGARATISRFEQLSTGWIPGERIDVLDLASGSGGMARALADWGRHRGFDLHVTAVDNSRRALDYARRSVPPDAPVHLLCADIRMPFCRDRAFDYVMSSLFFHHLTDEQTRDTLRMCDRVARRGIVINDLSRSARTWLLTWLLTWPFHPILHHDGPLSVRRAFTTAELRAHARAVGIDWLTARTHLGERITLAGERPASR